MSPKLQKPRSRHSFRERIHQVILERIVRGDSLTIRDIIDEAGGGSITTVRQELAKCPVPTEATRVGMGAKTDAQRVPLLEKAVNESLDREKLLIAENKALKDSLDAARADVDKLMATHQHSQRMLLQGVDDLRQMVKAGSGALPQAVLEAERQKAAPVATDDSILWKARHDQLLQRFVALDAKCRKMAAQLHDLGADVD